ncbi:MAG: 50S ribosomal protein L18 [Patescibacteria group bacterium]
MTNLKRKTAKDRRIARVRMIVRGTAERPRLAVVRSLKHISVQVIDDVAGRTLVTATDADIKAKGKKKTEVATLVGKLIAERATSKGITKVVFDRRDKRYHGRVKAVADGARVAGLIF